MCETAGQLQYNLHWGILKSLLFPTGTRKESCPVLCDCVSQGTPCKSLGCWSFFGMVTHWNNQVCEMIRFCKNTHLPKHIHFKLIIFLSQWRNKQDTKINTQRYSCMCPGQYAWQKATEWAKLVNGILPSLSWKLNNRLNSVYCHADWEFHSFLGQVPILCCSDHWNFPWTTGVAAVLSLDPFVSCWSHLWR